MRKLILVVIGMIAVFFFISAYSSFSMKADIQKNETGAMLRSESRDK